MTSIKNGSMLKSTFDARKKRLAVFMRCLEVAYPGDMDAQREHARSNFGITHWSMSNYRRQMNSKGHISGGIPYAKNLAKIEDCIEEIIEDFGLSKDGKAKPGNALNPPPRPVGSEFYEPVPGRLFDPKPVERSAPRPLVTGAAASPVEIVRTLMTGMDKASLKVIQDHLFELSTKA